MLPIALLICLLSQVSCSSAAIVTPGPTPTTTKLIRATAQRSARPPNPLPQRLFPKAYLRSKKAAASVEQAAAGAESHKPGQFIVLYKPGVDVQAAVASTQAAAAGVVAAAVAAGELATAAAAEPSSLVGTLRVREPPAGSSGLPGHAVISLPAELSAETVRQQLAAAPGVQAVVRNKVVRLAQGTGACAAPSFASGVVAEPVKVMNWPGCLGARINTGLALFGERCGDKLEKFRWTGIMAYNKATGEIYNDCVNLAASEADPKRAANIFSGSCGVAPAAFPAVPTTVCLENAGSSCIDEPALQGYRLSLTASFCGSSSISMWGAACGPNNALIQWSVFGAGPSCPTVTRDSTIGDLKKQADWLGQCGVAPFQLPDLPTRICGRQPDASSGPGPAQTPLPTAALVSGEPRSSWNMQRVGVFDPSSNRVLDPSAAIAATGYKVVTVDTGIDSSHPDLNVVEFVDLVDTPGSAFYGKDGDGHGTHVGGIIGARNQGSGVYGVVPGMPLVAYKVLDAEGDGDTDTVWEAYKRIIARLQAKDRIAAINLSLGYTITTAEMAVECSFIKAITDYGVAVVAAAGNGNGAEFRTTAPAACDTAMVVTSLTSLNMPDDSSNVAFAVSPWTIKNRVFSAPGANIYSTYTGGGYQSLTGTSMAAPHATGVVAACVLSGFCRTSDTPDTPAPSVNYPVLVEAARSAPCETSLCPPQFGWQQKWYGYTVSVLPWRGALK